MMKKKTLIILCVSLALVLAALAAAWVMLWGNIGATCEDEAEAFVFEEDYAGEHMVAYTDLWFKSVEDRDSFTICDVLSFSEYASFCEKFDLEQRYTDESKKYIVFSDYFDSTSRVEARVADVVYNGSKVILYVRAEADGYTATCPAYCVIVPTDRNVKRVQREQAYLPEDLEPEEVDYEYIVEEKPILYLYPTEETEISVKLGYEDLITVSYPKYEGEWKVLARPDGSLTDLRTGRDLYALYYESESPIDYQIEKDGFVVRGEDSIEFLEEKLAILGLTDREAEEFIVYWLPKLEANPYNYIRFATAEEIESTMPLDIQPAPDNTIRILMGYQGLEQPITVEEQKLETPEREGFTAVEWGGFEIP